MKNNKVKAVLLLAILMICLQTHSQSIYDNPYKVYGNDKRKITSGSVHLPRANSDTEKAFYHLEIGESIPDEIWELTNLKVLEIGNGSMRCCPVLGDIPNKLNDLTKLEYLYLGPGVTSIPTDLSNLTNLKSIFIAEPEAVEVEIEQLTDFSNLPTLQVIYFQFNKKKDISTLEYFPTIFELPNLKILALNMSKLSSDVFRDSKLNQLEIIEMNDNELQEIPSIYDNKQLKQLYLSENELISVNSRIGQLENLEVLNLSYNNLTELPSEMGNLSNLKSLNLTENKLEELPDSFKNLDQLEYLMLRGTNLTEIPEFVYQLKNLKMLDLMLTRISTIDERILQTNLETIWITHQDVGGFNFDPKMIAQLKSLKSFKVSSLRVEKEVLKSKAKLKRLRPDL